MIGRLLGALGSTAQLQVQRQDQATPLDIAVVRRSRPEVRVEDGKLVIEAVGGRQIFEFETGKPIAVVPSSDLSFYVDGRYHTQIAFLFSSDPAPRLLLALAKQALRQRPPQLPRQFLLDGHG